MPEIEKEYIKTGKVKYVIKDFPLEAIHKEAFKAHEAANCAGDQGRYWEMHDKIFSDRKGLNLNNLKKYAETLGLDMQRFNECLDSGGKASEIRRDMQEGIKAGVRSTPTFLLGLTDPEDLTKVKATVMIRGAHPYPKFKEAIERLLSSKGDRD